MSRWSAERLRIGLAPDRVELARPGFWPRRRTDHPTRVACTPRLGEPAWQAALDALDAALAEHATRGAAVTVVLSNHFVRYLLLPWHPQVTRAAEIEQLARVRFEQTYGAAAAGWTLRSADCGWGAPQVACAIDSALIAGLQQRLAARGLRLRSLQPLLMAAYNEQRRQLSDGGSAFAVIEPGRISLCLLAQGRWLDVGNRRCAGNAAEAIEQELASRDADTVPAQLDVLLVGDDVRWSAHPTRPARLLGRPAEPGGRSLAMCGAA